jgi:hypothetical protein
MAGYGIKVQTDTGYFVWLTDEGTSAQKSKAIKFDSEMGAEMVYKTLVSMNPHATFLVAKL